MHILALIFVAAAGATFCGAAVLRWLALARGADARRGWWAIWLGIALLSLGLIASLLDGTHLPFTYGVLGSWAAVASVVFLARYLTLPSRGLLVLPVGGMALLVAMASIAGPNRAAPEQAVPWITMVHVAFMATHMAAVLVTGAAGCLWLLTRRQLKAAAPGVLKLPSLPLSATVVDRGMVVSAALLIGGLATGGAAMQQAPDFTLAHGTPILALVAMALLIALLGLRASGTGHRRSLAWGSLVLLLVTASSVVSLLVSPPHG
ncbi:MAG: hypothetical protein PF961_00500 [Planctomycetota bacterium]|nr:hypothetical protein [Planctomycetota bacterium]